ncbi:MAG: monooxygenase [Acidimicrobiaceae bacterium]|nr:monooxygenase [Acidimicrobiaceae bacterium]
MSNDAREGGTIGDMADANIPVLLMVLVQLTGDLRWLEPPYRPRRAHGMGDNPTGGLPEHVQSEIREAAVAAIDAWRAGEPVAIPEPSDELLVEMLAAAMGEPVPDEYGPMIAAELGIQRGSDLDVDVDADEVEVPEGFSVLVVGAGVSGICAGVNLKRAGIPFTIVEKNSTVGGVWLQNRYPGAGVDTPNHLYSFSFLEHDWSHYFALRDELHGYLESVTDTFGLRPDIRFGTEVRAARFDEDRAMWQVVVQSSDGGEEILEANVLISAVGIFNPPKWPEIPGLRSFGDGLVHTAEWDPEIDVTGARVGVIGTGASAMQTVPAIADAVASLTIFQRSPQWAAPFEQFQSPVPDGVRSLLRDVPLYRKWYRLRLGWTFNDRTYESLQKDPAWPHPERSLNAINDAHREYFTRYIRSELGGRTDLEDVAIPEYPPFGKRMLMDNGWFRTIARDHVRVVSESIDEVRPKEVVTKSGETHQLDVLVVATGFDVLRFVSTYEVRGRGGRSLREVWDDDDARAYLGTSVPGFPNFFMLYGPNTQPGHGGSLMFIVEAQMHYVLSLIRQTFSVGARTVECRRDVHDRYNEAIDQAHERMVWTHPGMQTYYRNSRGRVVVNLPYRNVDFWHMTRHANVDDFEVGSTVGAG